MAGECSGDTADVSLCADPGKIDSCNQLPGYKYCLVVVPGFTDFGACVPNSCTVGDLFEQPFFTFLARMAPVTLLVGSSPDSYNVYCGSQEQPWETGSCRWSARGWSRPPSRLRPLPESPGTYATVSLIAIIGAVCAAATLRAVLAPAPAVRRDQGGSAKGRAPRPPLWASVLACFDLAAGCGRLVAMKGSDRSGPLAALNGVRVLSMALVVLGHTFIFATSVPGFVNFGQALLPPVRAAALPPLRLLGAQAPIPPPAPPLHLWLLQNGAMASVPFQIIPSAEFAVDTFFLLSGFLATFSLVKALAPPVARPPAAASAAGPAWLPRWLRQELSAPRRKLAKPLGPTLVYFVVHRLWRSERARPHARLPAQRAPAPPSPRPPCPSLPPQCGRRMASASSCGRSSSPSSRAARGGGASSGARRRARRTGGRTCSSSTTSCRRAMRRTACRSTPSAWGARRGGENLRGAALTSPLSPPR